MHVSISARPTMHVSISASHLPNQGITLMDKPRYRLVIFNCKDGRICI